MLLKEEEKLKVSEAPYCHRSAGMIVKEAWDTNESRKRTQPDGEERPQGRGRKRVARAEWRDLTHIGAVMVVVPVVAGRRRSESVR